MCLVVAQLLNFSQQPMSSSSPPSFINGIFGLLDQQQFILVQL